MASRVTMLCALNEASNPSTDNRPLYFLWSDLHVTHTDNVLLLSVYVPTWYYCKSKNSSFFAGGGGVHPPADGEK